MVSKELIKNDFYLKETKKMETDIIHIMKDLEKLKFMKNIIKQWRTEEKLIRFQMAFSYV